MSSPRWSSSIPSPEADCGSSRSRTMAGPTFFLAGVLGLYPVLWIDIMLGTLIAVYCIYLLYLGTGPVMAVPPERGFLYASAVFAVALVSFVALLGATVVLWDLGPTPEYTYRLP